MTEGEYQHLVACSAFRPCRSKTLISRFLERMMLSQQQDVIATMILYISRYTLHYNYVSFYPVLVIMGHTQNIGLAHLVRLLTLPNLPQLNPHYLLFLVLRGAPCIVRLTTKQKGAHAPLSVHASDTAYGPYRSARWWSKI